MAVIWTIPCTVVTIPMFVLFSSIATQSELVGERYVGGYEVGHPELCPAFGSELMLIIFVTSAPSHFKQREAIRMTWGDMSKFSNVSLAFFIGIPSNESRSLILEEESIYRDMIIARFIDTYDNLTLKSISMLEWLNTYCPVVPRMLKTDDDMFINVPLLLTFVEKTIQMNRTKTIWGKLSTDFLRVPVRNITSKYSKYFVTKEEFPGNEYPAFVTGSAYMMSTDVTRDLFAAAIKEPYFKIEDVFITGIVAKKLNIKRFNVGLFYNSRIYGEPWCILLNYISVHDINSDELLETWRELQLGTSFCTS